MAINSNIVFLGELDSVMRVMIGCGIIRWKQHSAPAVCESIVADERSAERRSVAGYCLLGWGH